MRTDKNVNNTERNSYNNNQSDIRSHVKFGSSQSNQNDQRHEPTDLSEANGIKFSECLKPAKLKRRQMKSIYEIYVAPFECGTPASNT